MASVEWVGTTLIWRPQLKPTDDLQSRPYLGLLMFRVPIGFAGFGEFAVFIKEG